MKRAILAILALAIVSTHASWHLEAQTPPSFTFFKSFMITGDYVVEGVGLRGTGVGGVAAGQIEVEGVPAGVDIAAAFLYWQVEASTLTPEAGSSGVSFRGQTLNSAEGSFGKKLGLGS